MFYTDVLQVLAVDKVEFFSQPIGIIVAGLYGLYDLMNQISSLK